MTLPFYLNPTAQARIKAQMQFECENCGACCTTCTPIEVSDRDVERLAEFYKKKPMVIVKRHCKRNPENPKALALKKDRPCKFYDLEKKRCKIYEARLDCCRSFPFLSHEPMWSNRYKVPEYCKGAMKIYQKMLENGEVKEVL